MVNSNLFNLNKINKICAFKTLLKNSVGTILTDKTDEMTKMRDKTMMKRMTK